jgi:hypothetical protein
VSATRRITSKERPGLKERLGDRFGRALERGVDLAEDLAVRLLANGSPLAPHMTRDEKRALAVERVVKGVLGRTFGRSAALTFLGAERDECPARLLFLPVCSRSIAGAGTGYRVLFAVCARPRRREGPQRLSWRVAELDGTGRRRGSRTFPDREQALLAYYL